MNTVNACANCGANLPETRTRYCSDGCMVLWKREQARLKYEIWPSPQIPVY